MFIDHSLLKLLLLSLPSFFIHSQQPSAVEPLGLCIELKGDLDVIGTPWFTATISYSGNRIDGAAVVGVRDTSHLECRGKYGGWTLYLSGPNGPMEHFPCQIEGIAVILDDCYMNEDVVTLKKYDSFSFRFTPRFWVSSGTLLHRVQDTPGIYTDQLCYTQPNKPKAIIGFPQKRQSQ